MTTRSIPAWSTASSSPARWSWDTSIAHTLRIHSRSVFDISGRNYSAHDSCLEVDADDVQDKAMAHDDVRVRRGTGTVPHGGRSGRQEGTGSLHSAEMPDVSF